ncbi:TetR/AcrR family transcriptional regulator [Dyella sp. 2HG41-7]|uniref:TetR/AcrR family transcriptional regulator n=1 Tax=Dyella sp. 2HG41-7 TaxID=2883239 RepID=UPI001F4804B2|nr:TetR/AcrR family transcriptional regulator [Dyella sp. 2HG41-7]
MDTHRKPQRQRGHDRVAALLEAAASCFVEKGYEAATMTEVAARAGAAIGSLYQFFPTKETLARALLEQYAQDFYTQLGKLAEQSSTWTTEEWAAQLCPFLIGFRKRHPAFVTLVESSVTPAADAMIIRRRFRAELQALLAHRAPHRSQEETYAAAVVVQQMMKGAAAIQAEPGMPGKLAALAQLQRAMQGYLHGVFGD